MLCVRIKETFPKFTDKPGPPRNLNVKELSENSVTLRWSAPDNDGGSPIKEYIVEKREGNKRMWQSAGTTSDFEITVPRLIEGNQYVFRVSAENACGVGEPVDLSETVIPKSRFSKCPMSCK